MDFTPDLFYNELLFKTYVFSSEILNKIKIYLKSCHPSSTTPSFFFNCFLFLVVMLQSFIILRSSIERQLRLKYSENSKDEVKLVWKHANYFAKKLRFCLLMFSIFSRTKKSILRIGRERSREKSSFFFLQN